MAPRIYFLDNLRTFLIFLVVLYHSAIVFQPGFENSWIVSDPVKSNLVGLIGLYGDVFAMSMIFFISGHFMPSSLRKKNSMSFLKSKFKRTMIPWIIAVFTLIPAYKAIFLFARGLPQEEWFSYFHLFQRTGADLSLWSNDPTQHWLWFLPLLFLFQILYLGLSKTKLLSLNISLRTGVILTFAVGLAYSLVISALDLRGWTYTAILDFQREKLLIYFMVFLLGSLCYKLKVFESDRRNKKYLIISNVVLGLGITVFTVVALNFFINIVVPDRNYFIVSRPVDVFAYYVSFLLCMFTFLHIILDAFRFNLNKSNNLIRHLNQYSYQVYIIHMIVIGGVALLLVDLAWPVFIKFPLVTILSYSLSNLIVFAYKRTIRQFSMKAA